MTIIVDSIGIILAVWCIGVMLWWFVAEEW